MKFKKVSFEEYKNSIRGDVDLTAEYNDIKLPKRATTGSAGYDFFSPFSFDLDTGETIKIPTGIRVILDNDKWLGVYPRSGLGFKYRVQLDNTVGVIDSDYRGEIKVALINQGKESFTIEKGMRIAQLVVHPIKLPAIKEVDEIRKTERNDKGFGSTGLK